MIIGNFEINKDNFEHIIRGDECSGTLEFDGKHLIDFDGLGVLPVEVAFGLRKRGKIVDVQLFCDMTEEEFNKRCKEFIYEK